MIVWTAQVSLVVGLTLGVAWPAHRVGRSAALRARLRRLVLHRAFTLSAAGVAVAGLVLLASARGASQPPRRYVDYLPDGDGVGFGFAVTGTTGPPLASVLAGLLIGGSVALLAVRLWLGPARRAGRYSSLLPHSPLVAGVVLLVAAFVTGWTADFAAPSSFGWYMYSPLTDEAYAPFADGGNGRVLTGVAAALAAVGLGMLTALAAFRVGRQE